MIMSGVGFPHIVVVIPPLYIPRLELDVGGSKRAIDFIQL